VVYNQASYKEGGRARPRKRTGAGGAGGAEQQLVGPRRWRWRRAEFPVPDHMPVADVWTRLGVAKKKKV
jgi:hypothetical protein